LGSPTPPIQCQRCSTWGYQCACEGGFGTAAASSRDDVENGGVADEKHEEAEASGSVAADAKRDEKRVAASTFCGEKRVAASTFCGEKGVAGSAHKARYKSKKDLLVVQINPNCWEGAKRWLSQGSGKAGAIVCGQEHKLTEEVMHGAFGALRKEGYMVAGSPAIQTLEHGDARHRSAGTFVAVATHIHSEPLECMGRSNLAPQDAPGRLSGQCVDWDKGLACFSAYLQDMVGWNDINVAVVQQLALVTYLLDQPWLVSLDANMDPQQFMDNDIVRSMGGRLVRASGGTCRHKDNWKCYDFFLVSQDLWHSVVGVEKFADWPTTPHVPVGLRIRQEANATYVRRQVVPRALPTLWPIGCARAPDSAWCAETDGLGTLTDRYGRAIRSVEAEVLGRHDICPGQRVHWTRQADLL
jgi:hypothetical protein